MHYSLLNLILFFLLKTIPGFEKNPSEKRLSKESCINLRLDRGALPTMFLKEFGKLKRLDAKEIIKIVIYNLMVGGALCTQIMDTLPLALLDFSPTVYTDFFFSYFL
jgi:hypothetical protein